MGLLALIFSLVALGFQNPGLAWTFELINNCSYTVWPAIMSTSIDFSLQKGESQLIDIPSGSPVRLWGRTQCSNSTGIFVCKTGDCGTGNLSCSGNNHDISMPTTLIEFSLYDSGGRDFYDISLVDGYNLPVMVAPQVSGCQAIGCILDNGTCPQELRVGGACASACTVFQTPQYCCTSSYSTPLMCKPTNYSQFFKKACPQAYSYAYDEATATFSCVGSPYYTITFCPSSQAMNSTSALSPPLPPTDAPVFPPTDAPLLPPTELSQSPNKSPLPSPSNLTSRRTRTVLVAITITVVVTILLFGIWFCVRKRKAVKRYQAEIEDMKSVESLQFDLSTIRAATHNFSAENKLGQGGFGEVYKGQLENGQKIAIKRLSKNSGQGAVEFKTEVVLVAKLQHKNLVKLLGFCVTSDEKILVYEYLPNSSLDKLLFDQTKDAALEWQTRLKIVVGIARGLLYLHEDSRLTVIHRDLKSSNILLDEEMNPKISDFGLAKLFEVDQTQGDTKRIVGTYGYMAPEYAITGHYSVKSDIYSFGVLLMEIVSGQKNRFFGRVKVEEALLHRAWRLWIETKPLDLVDVGLRNNFVVEEVMKCIHIGLLCVQEDPHRRPRITSIVAAFSGQSINLPMPKPPNFLGTDNANIEHHVSDEYASPFIFTGTKTITDLHPRD